MVAVPVQRTWTNDDALNTTNLNGSISDPIEFLLNKPAAMLRTSTVQNLASGSFVAFLFQAEDLDDDPDGTGGHSTSSNTSRYTARYPGWYWVGGGPSFAANATGRRGCRWAVNGTAVGGSVVMVPAAGANETLPAARAILVYLGVGDYVELHGYQTSGGTLATVATSDHHPSMALSWDRLVA